MAETIVYIDRSEIKPGAVDQVRRLVSDLVAFVDAREPQLVMYGFFVDDEAGTMTVVAVHPDAASLERHLDIGGSRFREVGALITLKSIEVFGAPGEAALAKLREKARALGNASVIVRSPAAGFARPIVRV